MTFALSVSTIALRVACAACTAIVAAPAVAGVADTGYPSAPLPVYAQDELQRVVDAATAAGSLPQARESERAQRAQGLQGLREFDNDEGQGAVAPQREENEPQASLRRDERPSKPRRQKRHHYV